MSGSAGFDDRNGTTYQSHRLAPDWFGGPAPTHTISGCRLSRGREGQPVTPVRDRVRVHGTDIAYWSAGPADGPLVLLIHGVASQSGTWQAAIGPLAERGLQVLAPDLPGHGESEPGHGDYSLGGFATLLRDLLGTLGLPAATLVGHSLGGGIALQFAHMFPARTQRMALVASGGLGTDAHPLLRLASAPGAELLLPVVMNKRVVWAMRRLRARVGEDRATGLLSEGALRNFTALSTRQGRAVFLSTVRSVINRSGQRVTAVGRLHLTEHVPTLLISCENDPAIPLAHARAAHEVLPGSRLEIIPGRSHRPHQAAPARFAEVVAEFIDSTDPAAESVSSP